MCRTDLRRSPHLMDYSLDNCWCPYYEGLKEINEQYFVHIIGAGDAHLYTIAQLARDTW